MTLEDAEAFAVAQGWPRFRGEQVWRWVHDKGARTFDEMTNLSASTREEFAARARIGCLEVAEVQTSKDGTRKLRLTTRDGSSIESVLIPMGEHVTQCISSQVGCAVDCQFCATAKLGLKRNLDAGEIVAQVYLGRRLLAEVAPDMRLSNIVYMGMGEPLHNYDNLVRSLRILTNDKGATSASRRRPRYTWSTISPASRLRLSPSFAVAQNWQSTAQPTCDEMHCVTCSPIGMRTLSIDEPSRVVSRSLRVPSLEVWTSATSRHPIRATAAISSRFFADRLVISSNDRAPLSWTQRQI